MLCKFMSTLDSIKEYLKKEEALESLSLPVTVEEACTNNYSSCLKSTHTKHPTQILERDNGHIKLG